MNIHNLFKILVEREGSDLYLRTLALPRIRVNGKLEVVSTSVSSKEEIIMATTYLLANDEKKKLFKENLDIDFIHEEPDVGRFRVNIFTQRGTPVVVARYIHSNIKTFAELNLPIELCEMFCQESKGLFLVCGPAGNGKSTTIASMIEYINNRRSEHIITIEDPLEFLFQDKKSIINQRELGIDVYSYQKALKHVTQQSPDIIYIGNIRDQPTMRAAINATELGAYVMTTFHTINAVQTIIRIVNFFAPHLHDEVRMQLSLILKGIISLRLLARKDGKGRVPAFETLVVTPTISRLIREGHIREIQEFIDEGKLFGMQSFKQSLVKRVKEGLVEVEEARKYADSKDEFDLELKGIKRPSDLD